MLRLRAADALSYAASVLGSVTDVAVLTEQKHSSVWRWVRGAGLPSRRMSILVLQRLGDAPVPVVDDVS